MSKRKRSPPVLDQDIQSEELTGLPFEQLSTEFNQICSNWPDNIKMTKIRALHFTLAAFGLKTLALNNYKYRKLSGVLAKKFKNKTGKTSSISNPFILDPSPQIEIPLRSASVSAAGDDADTKPSQQPNVQCKIDQNTREILQRNGIVRLPNVLNKRTVLALRIMIRRVRDCSNKKTFLSDSTGSGLRGFYSYFDPKDFKEGVNEASSLDLLRKRLSKALYPNDLDAQKKAKHTRMILLGYTYGGENWTHQDQSNIPFQALLMLSNPGEDFTGGELYVQDGEIPKVTDQHQALPPTHNQTSQFFNKNGTVNGSAGDVIIFKANKDINAEASGGKDFFHGMTTVRKGTNVDCERWAIGLFQPPSKNM